MPRKHRKTAQKKAAKRRQQLVAQMRERAVAPPPQRTLDPLPDGLTWYVISTATGRAKEVASELKRKSFPVYWPRELVQSTGRGAKVWKLVPMLPGYMFVAVDFPTRSFGEVDDVGGVVAFLRQPGARDPSAIPVGALQILWLAEHAQIEALRPKAEGERFDEGERVLAIDGPWAEKMGRVLAAERSERASILFDGWDRPVELPVSSLVRAA